jgi:hypothetical protein
MPTPKGDDEFARLRAGQHPRRVLIRASAGGCRRQAGAAWSAMIASSIAVSGANRACPFARSGLD